MQEQIADGPGYRRRARLMWTLALTLHVARKALFDDVAGIAYRLVSNVTPDLLRWLIRAVANDGPSTGRPAAQRRLFAGLTLDPAIATS